MTLRDGSRGRVFTKTIDFIFSDVHDCWQRGGLTRLRSHVYDVNGSLSGYQGFCRLDALNLGLRSNSIDLVLAFGLISPMVLALWRDVLSEMTRVGKRNATACITVPNRGGFATEVANELESRSLEILQRDEALDELPEMFDEPEAMRTLLLFRLHPTACLG